MYPNPMDPLNGEAASLMLHNPAKYEQKVKECVAKRIPSPEPLHEEPPIEQESAEYYHVDDHNGDQSAPNEEDCDDDTPPQLDDLLLDI